MSGIIGGVGSKSGVISNTKLSVTDAGPGSDYDTGCINIGKLRIVWGHGEFDSSVASSGSSYGVMQYYNNDTITFPTTDGKTFKHTPATVASIGRGGDNDHYMTMTPLYDQSTTGFIATCVPINKSTHPADFSFTYIAIGEGT